MSAGADKRGIWSFVRRRGAHGFRGGRLVIDPRRAPFDDKGWPHELPADQDEALYDLCLANGGANLSCDLQQRVISALQVMVLQFVAPPARGAV